MKKICKIFLVILMITPFLSVSAITKVNCGQVTDIPEKIPELTSMIFNIIQIGVPIILVLMGSIDLFKGVTSQKDEEIKKGQKLFIKRLIIGSLIFFIVAIVKFFVSIVADANSDDAIECIACFMNGKDSCK